MSVISLINRNIPYGQRTIKVKAKAQGFIDSNFSNTITWNCQPVLSIDKSTRIATATNINNNVTSVGFYVNGVLTETIGTSGGVDVSWQIPDDVDAADVITVKAFGDGVNENNSNESTLQLIFGATGFDLETSALERTDDAIGMSYVMSNNIISSDFDDVYPYSEMQRSTDANGDVWVYIPELYWRFGYDSSNNITSVACSQYPIAVGENQVAAHSQAFYFGAYGTSTGACSKSGVSRQYSRSITDFRSDATSKGLMQLDLAHMRIVDFLFCIEFATKNSDNVMWGYTSYGQSCGATDTLSVPTGQLANKGRMRYRYIEDFIGNGLEWFDGVFGLYVTDNPANFATTNGTQRASFSNMTSGYEITKLYCDTTNPFLATPSAVVNNSSFNTGFGDYCGWSSGSCVGFRGRSGTVAYCGLFYWGVSSGAGSANSYIGSRLLKTTF